MDFGREIRTECQDRYDSAQFRPLFLDLERPTCKELKMRGSRNEQVHPSLADHILDQQPLSHHRSGPRRKVVEQFEYSATSSSTGLLDRNQSMQINH